MSYVNSDQDENDKPDANLKDAMNVTENSVQPKKTHSELEVRDISQDGQENIGTSSMKAIRRYDLQRAASGLTQ